MHQQKIVIYLILILSRIEIVLFPLYIILFIFSTIWLRLKQTRTYQICKELGKRKPAGLLRLHLYLLFIKFYM